MLITIGGYAYIGLSMQGALPAKMGDFACSVPLLSLAAHLAVRRWAPRADPLILPIASLLTGLGLLLLHRLDITYAAKPYLKLAQAGSGQLVWTVIAVAACVGTLAMLRDYRRLQRYFYVTTLTALALLIAPAFFGADQFGARRWITLGPLTVQPGEFVKIAMAVLFASYLTHNRDALALTGRRFMGMKLPPGRQIGPLAVIWGISLMVLIFERDLGTSLLFFGLFVIMLYVATDRISWIVVGLLVAALGAEVVGSLEPHVQGRVEAWLHPMAAFTDAGRAAGISEQLGQALFGFGSGGLTGTGLGQGHPELIGFAGNSDFILTTVGEELGLAGLMAVLILYGLLAQRGFRIGVIARDPFGKLLAVGLAGALLLQVFIVTGGVTGLIPLTGKALPFLAKGGSSMVANWIMVALLVRISDSAERHREAHLRDHSG
ncbi:FtsW/RodA/SpoVE family cell cycle protein [Streptomyces kronopolitis]|uniref:FtsW/RodA/SpoVE family cell cycle protein n=1 Tax=Streptomyces kronopolitis TaxID=1612435 RepID=UPI0036AF496F